MANNISDWVVLDNDKALAKAVAKQNKWSRKTTSQVLDYQKDQLIAALKFVKEFDSAIDAGANYGIMSHHLHQRFNNVYAFELDSKVRACLEQNIAKFNLTSVKVFDCGLGDQEKNVSLKYVKNSFGTHIDPAINGGDEIIRTIEVLKVEQPIEQVIEQPIAQEPIAQVIEEPIEEPIEQVIEQPLVEEPIEQPLVAEEQIIEEQIIEEPVEQPTKQIIKLRIPSKLPNIGYNKDVAPKFWREMFENKGKGTDLFELKRKIRELLSQDEINNVINKQSYKENAWTTCEILERMFPAYYTKKNPEFELKTQEQKLDFVNTNTALCIILLLLGMISYKMEGQDYNFIFKGGKSVQFVLSEIQNTSKYISDDIDILLTHNDNVVYDARKMGNLAAHISFLIKWFLEGAINISLELPNTNVKTLGKDIIKISYLGFSGRYKALCDVGFGKTSEIVRPYFEHPQVFKMHNDELGEDLMFRCPNIDAILDEKLYYYLKFIQLRDIINQGSTIQEEGYEDMNVETLNFFIQKFKRSIKAIVDGLIMQQFGDIDKKEITDNERMILQYKLNKFNANNNFKEELIKSVLNSNPYEV